MLKRSKDMFGKYITKEIIVYIIIGGVTTAVNFAVYIILTRLFTVSEVISNTIAWLASVIFAFYANNYIVFKENDEKNFKKFLKFFLLRINSGIFEFIVFFLNTKVFKINDIIIKIIISIVVIVLNYIFSKKFIFVLNKNKG